jgi:hypothetical protein
MMPFIFGLAGVALAATIAVAGFEGLYRSRDTGELTVDLARRSPWEELPSATGRRFKCTLNIRNHNARYEQTLVDLKPQARLLTKEGVAPEELSIKPFVRALNADERSDGYWAATLVAANGVSPFELTVVIEGPAQALSRLHAAVISLEYTTYGRRDLKQVETELILSLSAVKPLPTPIQGKTVSIQCVPTPLLTDIDDIVEVIDRYTHAFRQPGDVVAVAESVVAITQRQYFRPQEITPGFWAKRLCYFVPSKGSLSSPHGFQTAMNQVGAWRMVPSMMVGALGKALGVQGLFYTLAGPPVELIDDITGTLPPFDKYIVAGPAEPADVVKRIRERTGMEAAIVDANDLKRVMVLAHTDGIEAAEISRLLLDNPFGNAAEQTPIVVLRPQTAAQPERSPRDTTCSV